MWSAVSKESPIQALTHSLIQVISSQQDYFFLSSRFFNHFTCFICHKGRTIETQARRLTSIFCRRLHFFQTDTIGCNDWGDIGCRMALHGPLPMTLAIRVQNRLRTNGCWIKEQFCPIQSQTASGFWEPLVPQQMPMPILA